MEITYGKVILHCDLNNFYASVEQKNHPEYAKETLNFYEHSFSAGDVYQKIMPDVLAAFLNDKKIIESVTICAVCVVCCL